MSILIGEKTMTINWNNITVTDASPDVPDFNLEFELHDGWDSEVSDTERLKYEETEGEDGDYFLDDSGEWEYNSDDDEDDWIDPTDDDLIEIETGEISWVN